VQNRWQQFPDNKQAAHQTVLKVIQPNLNNAAIWQMLYPRVTDQDSTRRLKWMRASNQPTIESIGQNTRSAWQQPHQAKLHQAITTHFGIFKIRTE
jgi:hypothetical protein